jgi:hypothetical protein
LLPEANFDHSFEAYVDALAMILQFISCCNGQQRLYRSWLTADATVYDTELGCGDPSDHPDV